MFSELTVLFTFGGILWWALTAAFVIFLFVAVENENGWGVSVSSIIYVLFLQFICRIDLIGYVLENPLSVMEVIGVYVVIGVLWSLIKWWLFVKVAGSIYGDKRDEFLRKNNAKGSKKIPSDLKVGWIERTRHASWAEIPLAENYKSKISRWIGYWPISMIWCFFDDFIKEVLTRIFNVMQKLYHKISDLAWEKYKGDFE